MFEHYDDFKVTLNGEEVQLQGQWPEQGTVYQNVVLKDDKGQDRALDDLVTGVTIISSVPDIETDVCSIQTRRLAEEVADKGYTFITVSRNTPEELQAWKEENNFEDLLLLSDVDGEFGQRYGVAVEGMDINARALFVTDLAGLLGHLQLVSEITDEPDYELALEDAQRLNKF